MRSKPTFIKKLVLTEKFLNSFHSSLSTFILIHPINAELKTWLGTGTSDWNTANNWSPSGVPDSDDEILIDHALFQSPCVINNSLITAKVVYIRRGQLQIKSDNGLGQLSCGNIFVGDDTFLINEGKLIVDADGFGFISGTGIAWNSAIRCEGKIINTYSSNDEVSGTGEIIIMTSNDAFEGMELKDGGDVSNSALINMTQLEGHGILMNGPTQFTNTGIINIVKSEFGGGIMMQNEGPRFTNYFNITIDEVDDEAIILGLADEVDDDNLCTACMFENTSIGSIYIGPTTNSTQSFRGIDVQEGIFKNNGDIFIDNIYVSAIRVKNEPVDETDNVFATFINEAFGKIEIGNQIGIQVGSGVYIVDAEFINQGTIEINKIDAFQGVTCEGCTFINEETARIEIDFNDEWGDAGFVVFDNGELINLGNIDISGSYASGLNIINSNLINAVNGEINIYKAGIHGIELDNGSINNEEGGKLSIDFTLGNGIHINSSSHIVNKGNSEIHIDSTGWPAISMLGGSSLSNKENGLIVVNKNGRPGITSNNEFTLEISGFGNSVLNDTCSEMQLYYPDIHWKFWKHFSGKRRIPSR